MIVKKVKNPRKSAAKAARVRGLVDYIAAPERAGSDEKCVYAGARGFLSSDLESQKAEMLALSQEAVRSKDTINHYVISWREGEQPTPKQVEEAIDIFLDELGLQGHQAIYGLHADTDNLHLHLAVNRVHPETLKVIKPNKGFDIEAAHRAIARIEHAQGWQRELHGRYQVMEKGLELELDRVPRNPDRVRQPASPKRDMEQRTGEKSAERIAIEAGAPVIRHATSWGQMHRELAERGMRYEKTGSGAILRVGKIRIKASSADREASLARLQKRLGPYEAAPERQPVAERVPEPVQRDVPGWATYIAGRKAHQADKSAAQGVATLDRARRQESESRQLAGQHERRRAELLQSGWQGRGELREALQSILAAEQAAEKAELAERHRAERGQQREEARQRFGAYPDLEQWQRQRGRPELAERWRYRARARARANGLQQLKGRGDDHAALRDIRGFVGEIFGREVHYRRRGEQVDLRTGPGKAASPDPEVAFIDKGPQIDILDWQDRDTTLAALQLGAQKWGRMEVDGNDNYKAMCASLAAEHGFEVTNPELQ
ncbi:MAG: relaxase/mobilization nuclease domain-containing protein [Pseudomonadota bacterium]|nr:relaxase/mobilization nuclease domain-containing protein [Pseudomonadota bacterium]